MHKAFKIALEKNQIDIKNNFNKVDSYEIHLYGNDNDHFELYNTLTKTIRTVHYPLNRSDIIQVAKECETEYFDKVIDLCKKTKAILVTHADNPLSEVMDNPLVDKLCSKLMENDITIYVENGYKDVSCKEAYLVYKYMVSKLDYNHCFPLLDICHLCISQQSFEYADYDFKTALDLFSSSRFSIHLSDAIGSGEWQTGGVHGSNFQTNQALLKNILNYVKKLEESRGEVNLVLEVEEEDFSNPINAIKLANNIDDILEKM